MDYERCVAYGIDDEASDDFKVWVTPVVEWNNRFKPIKQTIAATTLANGVKNDDLVAIRFDNTVERMYNMNQVVYHEYYNSTNTLDAKVKIIFSSREM